MHRIKRAWNQDAERDHLRATLGVCRSRYPEFFGKLEDFPFQFTKSKKGMKVLEVGCGWGRATVAPAEAGAESFGIDISPSFASLAKKRAKSKGCLVYLVVASSEALPFKENTFDAVHSWFVLQHMSKGAAAKTVKEVQRVLKLAGEFHFQLPNKFGTDELVEESINCLKKYMLRRESCPVDTFSFVKFYTLSEIRGLVQDFHSMNIRALEFRLPKYFFPFFPRKVLKPLRELSDYLERVANSKLSFLKNIICTDFIVVAKKSVT